MQAKQLMEMDLSIIITTVSLQTPKLLNIAKLILGSKLTLVDSQPQKIKKCMEEETV